MKKVLSFLMITFLTTTFAYAADDYAFKVTAGYLLSPTIASEIVLDEDSSVTALEEFKGEPGYQAKLSLLISHLEISYLLQQYSAKKDEEGETGEISFGLEATELAIYAADPIANDGFNAFIGLGRGTTHIKVDRTVNNVKVIDDGVAYAKELHYNLGLSYGFSEDFDASVVYTSQSLKTVSGKEFSNTMAVLSFGFIF